MFGNVGSYFEVIDGIGVFRGTELAVDAQSIHLKRFEAEDDSVELVGHLLPELLRVLAQCQLLHNNKCVKNQ